MQRSVALLALPLALASACAVDTPHRPIDDDASMSPPRTPRTLPQQDLDAPMRPEGTPVIDDAPPVVEPPPVVDEPPPVVDGPRTFVAHLTNVAPWTLFKSGVFDTPVGRAAAGPIRRGDAYEVTFTAGNRHKLSFALMLGASNDWIYATPPEGIPLYTDGVAKNGDVTSMIRLYDVGTEIDQEPAVGADTGPMQDDPAQGAADPVAIVRAVPNPVMLTDGSMFTLPSTTDVLRATVVPVGDRTFRLRIENVSAEGALVTSAGTKNIALSPGVWTLHTGDDPLFGVGEADRGAGLELIAESGRAATLGAALAETSGIATPFSPGVFVVHHSGKPLFAVGQPDRGQGLERIAENGDVSILDDALGTAFPDGASLKNVFNTVDGASSPGPVRPGQTYTFTFAAMPGDRLSLASMYGVSNDWFVGTPDDGLALFSDDGQPVSGDVTGDLAFYDVGTEIDEEPFVGAHVGPNQASFDDGPIDPIMMVRLLDPTTYARPVAEHLVLTLSVE